MPSTNCHSWPRAVVGLLMVRFLADFLLDRRENHNRRDRSTPFRTRVYAAEGRCPDPNAGRWIGLGSQLLEGDSSCGITMRRRKSGLICVHAAPHRASNICGFYVTGSDKSFPDAGKACFALFFWASLSI